MNTKKITASEALTKAWEIFKQNALQHLGIFLLLIFILAIFQSLSKNVVMSIINFIVEFLVAIFIYGYSLDVIRGEYKGLNAVINKYFTQEKMLNFLIYYVIVLLVAAILLLPMIFIIFFGATFNKYLGLLMAALGSVAIFLIMARLFFAPFYIVDKGMNGIDALSRSWQDTRPYFGEILLLLLLQIVLIFVGLLACGIGVLVAIPVVYFMQTLFYDAIAGEGEHKEMIENL